MSIIREDEKGFYIVANGWIVRPRFPKTNFEKGEKVRKSNNPGYIVIVEDGNNEESWYRDQSSIDYYKERKKK